MKKAMSIVISLGVLMLGSVMTASAATALIRIDVPFAFNAGGVALPAGSYVVDMGVDRGVGSHVVLRVADGSDAIFVPTTCSNWVGTGSFGVSFTRYGETYFLSKIMDGDLEAKLPKTRAEKELATNGAGTTIALLVR
jgi:hypothetical protein